MNKFRNLFQNHKAIILVSLGLALSTGVAGYAIVSKIALEKQFQQQTSEAKETHDKILAMSNTIGDLQSKLDGTLKDIQRLQSEVDTERSKIAAFAKQAASCDKIKKRLRIKE